MTDADTLVIGAGPAGSACAAALAAAGHDVTVLEREAAPRETVCGEFLGPDAAAALARLGLHPATLGAAPVASMRWGVGRHERRRALPFAAWGLPRRTLDAALAARAEAAGATVRRGIVVRGATPTPEGWRVRTDAGDVLARCVVLAIGKHALRDHPRDTVGPGWVGLKLHLDGLDLPAEVAVLLFPGGYAGLQPLPDGGANLCVALRAAPHGLGDANALLARVAAGSALGARLLAGARPRWPRALAVAAVPYGFRHRGGIPALYRVGDQAAVVPSFTGEGVALALHSGLAAAAAIVAGTDAPDFHADWRSRSAAPLRWAGAAAWWLRTAPPALLAASAWAAPPLARRTRFAA